MLPNIYLYIGFIFAPRENIFLRLHNLQGYLDLRKHPDSMRYYDFRCDWPRPYSWLISWLVSWKNLEWIPTYSLKCNSRKFWVIFRIKTINLVWITCRASQVGTWPNIKPGLKTGLILFGLVLRHSLTSKYCSC